MVFMFNSRDKNFIIETLTERAFNVELNFRHLKCLALKFYACLDPERHAQFVQKLEKLEAPRLDVVLKMRKYVTCDFELFIHSVLVILQSVTCTNFLPMSCGHTPRNDTKGRVQSK